MDLNGSNKGYKPTYNWGKWGGHAHCIVGFPSGKTNKHKPNIIDKLQIHEDVGKPNPMKSHGFIIIFPITIAINLHRPMI